MDLEESPTSELLLEGEQPLPSPPPGSEVPPGAAAAAGGGGEAPGAGGGQPPAQGAAPAGRGVPAQSSAAVAAPGAALEHFGGDDQGPPEPGAHGEQPLPSSLRALRSLLGLQQLLEGVEKLLGPEGVSPQLREQLQQAEASLPRARRRWLRLELLWSILGEMISCWH